jgi:dihydrofolate reductase
MRKHVASRSLREPLDWENSTLLGDDVPGAVARLKQDVDGDLLVIGSGELVQTLAAEGLVDEFRLMVHPIVLGGGRKLFGDGTMKASLRLVDSTATPHGVLMLSYEPAAEGSEGEGGTR